MSVALAVMLGPFIIAGLLLFFSSSLDEEHFPLKLLLSIFAIIALMIGASSNYDSQELCNLVPDNVTRTFIDAVNFTDSYDYACFTASDKAGSSYTIMKMAQWLVILLITYAFVYLSYKVLVEPSRKRGKGG